MTILTNEGYVKLKVFMALLQPTRIAFDGISIVRLALLMVLSNHSVRQCNHILEPLPYRH